MVIGYCVLLGLIAAPQFEAPPWSKEELRGFFMRIQAASQAPDVNMQDNALAEVGGLAYRVPPQAGEPREIYAERVLKKRVQTHPPVKKGQWLTALTRQLYEDLSKRAAQLARFETARPEQQWLEQFAQGAAQTAQMLDKQIEVSVEGLPGFVEPLPVVPGDTPTLVGAMATVKGGVIAIENMDRARFTNDQPAPDAARRAGGALREVYSAFQQYNINASMLGSYDAQARKNKGHFRVVIPARSPALYLNELVRGGLEAKAHTVHLMVMNPQGELKEISLPLQPPTKKAKKTKGKKAPPPEPVKVTCEDQHTMQQCAERIHHGRSQGQVWYRPE